MCRSGSRCRCRGSWRGGSCPRSRNRPGRRPGSAQEVGVAPVVGRGTLRAVNPAAACPGPWATSGPLISPLPVGQPCPITGASVRTRSGEPAKTGSLGSALPSMSVRLPHARHWKSCIRVMRLVDPQWAHMYTSAMVLLSPGQGRRHPSFPAPPFRELLVEAPAERVCRRWSACRRCRRCRPPTVTTPVPVFRLRMTTGAVIPAPVTFTVVVLRDRLEERGLGRGEGDRRARGGASPCRSPGCRHPSRFRRRWTRSSPRCRSAAWRKTP